MKVKAVICDRDELCKYIGEIPYDWAKNGYLIASRPNGEETLSFDTTIHMSKQTSTTNRVFIVSGQYKGVFVLCEDKERTIPRSVKDYIDTFLTEPVVTCESYDSGVKYVSEFQGLKGVVDISGFYVKNLSDETIAVGLANGLTQNLIPAIQEKVNKLRTKEE